MRIKSSKIIGRRSPSGSAIPPTQQNTNTTKQTERKITINTWHIIMKIPLSDTCRSRSDFNVKRAPFNFANWQVISISPHMKLFDSANNQMFRSCCFKWVKSCPQSFHSAAAQAGTRWLSFLPLTAHGWVASQTTGANGLMSRTATTNIKIGTSIEFSWHETARVDGAFLTSVVSGCRWWCSWKNKLIIDLHYGRISHRLLPVCLIKPNPNWPQARRIYPNCLWKQNCEYWPWIWRQARSFFVGHSRSFKY